MNKPVYSIKLGRVSGSVFVNEKNGSTWYSTKIVSSFKDDSGEWQDTQNFDSGDLGNVMAVAEWCRNFIMSKTRKIEG